MLERLRECVEAVYLSNITYYEVLGIEDSCKYRKCVGLFSQIVSKYQYVFANAVRKITQERRSNVGTVDPVVGLEVDEGSLMTVLQESEETRLRKELLVLPE